MVLKDSSVGGGWLRFFPVHFGRLGRSLLVAFCVGGSLQAAPEISCPADISTANEPGQCAAIVTYDVTASEAATLACDPVSGSLFSVGSATVNCTAEQEGELAQCSFLVTVNDTAAPIMSCPADMTAECDGLAGTLVTFVATVTDNCEAGLISHCEPESGSMFVLGMSTVICDSIDSQGNSNSCSFKVTVQDSTGPAVFCPADLSVGCTGPAGRTVVFAALASDVCDSSVPVTCSPSSGSVFPVGTTTVECTASDGSGNNGSCSFVVSVVDSVKPSVICPADVRVECEDTSGTPVGFVVLGTDICDSNVDISCSPASGSVFTQGTTSVQCTATDDSGNSAHCSFSVTVADTRAPALVCSTDLVVACVDSAGSVVEFATAVTDGCDGAPTVTCSPPSGSVFASGLTTVQCEAVDSQGNHSTCSFTVTVEDNQAPVMTCSADLSVECSDPAGTAVQFSSLVSDNCDVGLVAVCEPASGSLFSLGVTTVQCRTADGSGNTNVCTFTVTLQDITAPVLSCPSDLSVECADAGGATVDFDATASDSCGGAAIVVCDPSSGTRFSVGLSLIECRTWDAANNTNTCSFSVTVLDRTGPAIVCPVNRVLECPGSGGISATFEAAASDLCDSAAVAVCVPSSGSTFFRGVTPVLCQAVDSSGNSASCSFTVTVQDKTSPSLTCSTNWVVECSSSAGTPVSFSASAIDVCDPNVTLVCTPVSGALFPAGVTTVECSTMDLAGNTARCTFRVTVLDHTAPGLVCPADMAVECSDPDGTTISYTIEVTDSCESSVALVCDPASGSRFPHGVSTVSCVASDSSLNTNQCSFTVEILDTTAPVLNCPSELVVESSSPTGTPVDFNLVVQDACDSSVSVICSPVSGSSFQLGATPVICVATDASGNTNQCSFILSIVDTTGPSLACPVGLTVDCFDATGAVGTYGVAASDNSDDDVVVVCTPPSGVGFPLGQTEVTCVSGDSMGNTNQCQFTVSVVDRVPPVMSCPGDMSTSCDGSSSTSFVFEPVASDNCDPGVSVVCTPASGSEFNGGVTVVVCRATDTSGNQSSCQFQVSVADSVPPTLTCPANMELFTVPGAEGALIDYSVAAGDDCDSSPTVVCAPPAGVVFPLGPTVVDCSATDDAGNEVACSFEVRVLGSFIVDKQLSNLRSDFTGFVGMKMTVGSSPLVVTHLGRIMVAGNTQTHTVKLVRVSTQQDVSGAAVVVSMVGGTPGEFVYAQLASPVTLEAGVSYYLVSSETAGADKWHNSNSELTSSSAGTVDSAVFVGSGYPWSIQGLARNSHGPSDFKYYPVGTGAGPTISLVSPANGQILSAPATIQIQATAGATVTNVEFFAGTTLIGADGTRPFSLVWSNMAAGDYVLKARATASNGIMSTSDVVNVSVITDAPGTEYSFILSKTLGSTRNDFSGFVGMKITTGPNRLTVTSVGRIVAPGNVHAHLVKLVRASDLSEVGAALVSTVGGVMGQFKYSFLPRVVTLEPNTAYFVVSEETSGGDLWYDIDTRLSPRPVAAVNSAGYSTGGQTWAATGGANQAFGPVDFRYVLGQGPLTPTVLITQPQDGTVFLWPTNVQIEAVASVGVTNVDFFAGAVLIGRDSQAPFSLTWTDPAPGLHQLTARGTATNGVSVVSPAVVIDLSTNLPPPTVAITNPSQGGLFVVPATVVIDAEVNVGITQVEFYTGANLLGADSTAPFGFTWVNAPQGNHSLSARAISRNGLMATSAVVNITVTTNPPDVEVFFVKSAAPGAVRNDYTGFLGMEFVVGPNPLELVRLGRMMVAGNSQTHQVKIVRAGGGDVAGASVMVSMAGGTPGQFRYVELAAPVTLAAHGDYYIVSQETAGGDGWHDVGGTTLVTRPEARLDGGVFGGPPWGTGGLPDHGYVPLDFSYIVNMAPTGPSVVIDPPLSGTVFIVPTNVLIGATASAGVVGVEFYAGTNKLGEDVSAPFTFQWLNPPTGSFQLTAVARDGGGLVSTSTVVQITLTADVPAPTVTLLQPSAGASFLSPVTIGLSAQATVGVTNVAFYANGVKLVEDDSAPFEFAWVDPAAGWYDLTATALNASGLRATSAVVSITVATNVPMEERGFLVSFNPQDLRNDINGYVGMEFTIGPNPVVVTELGRLCIAGNSGVHQLKLVEEKDGIDVPNAVVTISLAGATPGQFVYAKLAEPIVLRANALYFLVSQESVGGDYWYDVARTTLTGRSVASIDAGVFGPPWRTGGLANHSYGPVDFKYITQGGADAPQVTITSPGEGASFLAPANVLIETQVSEGVNRVEFFENGIKLGEDLTAPFSLIWTNPPPGEYQLRARAIASSGLVSTSGVVDVTITTNMLGSDTGFVLSSVAGTLRHNYNGWVGMKITVGTKPLEITALGRSVVSGNLLSHVVKILNTDGTDVPGATATVSLLNGTLGRFRYQPLPEVVTLSPLTSYYILSQETVDGDLWHDLNTLVTARDVATVDTAVFGSPAEGYRESGGLGHSFGPVDFKFRTPAVTITSPSEGEHFGAPTNLVVEALASLEVTRVEFFVDGVKFGEDAVRPFTFPWSTVLPGNYRFTATAMDANGHASTSSPLDIVVTNLPPSFPTVALTAPVAGAGFVRPVSVALAATASLGVTNVEFYANGLKVGQATGAPYQTTWVDPAPGLYSVMARAINFNGLMATSAVVGITVTNAPPPPPTISLTQPVHGATFVTPTNLVLAAATSGGVVRVEFLANGSLLGQDATAPYQFLWMNAPAGTHQLTARAVPTNGPSVLSAAVSISITNPPALPPTIAIVTPGEGASFVSPTNLLIEAAAGAGVTNVIFLADGLELGRTSTGAGSESQFLWVNPGAGSYRLTARAQSTNGLTGVSAPVHITVTTNLPVELRSLVIGKTLGTVRDNFAGFLGMRITVGPSPVRVTRLGRIMVAGNTGRHLLKIVRASTKLDVPGASAEVTMVGGVPGEFRYAELAAPVVLEPNTQYYVVSQEVFGADTWYELDTLVTPSSAATIDGPVYMGGGFPWTYMPSVNHSFVPVDLQYEVGGGPAPMVSITSPASGATIDTPSDLVIQAGVSAGITRVEFFDGTTKLGEDTSAPFTHTWAAPPPGVYALRAVALASSGVTVTSSVVNVTVRFVVTGTERGFVLSVNGQQARNNYNGFLGMEVLVGPEPITLTQLGRYVLPGNSGTHLVKLVRASTGVDVPNGSVTVNLQGAQANQFKYAPLSGPVILQANTGYYLVSQETLDGDQWYNVERTTLTSRTVASIEGGVFGGPSWSTGGLPGHGYVPLDFVYVSDDVQPALAPSVAAQRTNGQFELVVSGEVGRTYAIWATQDFVSWTLVTELTLSSQRQAIANPEAGQYTMRFYRVEAR